MARLAARRRSLVRLLIVLVVARMIVTVTEIVEEDVSVIALLVTVALAVEAWRGWSIARAARGAEAIPPPPADSGWEEALLRPCERYGPWVIGAFAVAYVIAYVALLVSGAPRDELIDIAAIAREVLLVPVILILVAGYRSARAQERAAAGEPSGDAPGPAT
jgi:hypothetical protein